MQPIINSPTLNAVLQLLIALGAICSIAAPYAGTGRFAGILHFVSSLGGDIVKTGRALGQIKDPETNQVPTPSTSPGPTEVKAP